MVKSSFLTFFFRDGVDIVIWSLFLPWLITFVDFCVHGSWAGAVLWYGLAFAALTAGRLLGQLCRSSSSLVQLWPLAILCISFVGLALTTRISFVIVLLFAIGFAGSNMTTREMVPSPSAMDRLKNIDFTVSIPSAAAVEAENEVNSQRKLAIMMFTFLASSVIYQESIVDSKWPMIVPCIAAALLFLGICCLNIWMLRNRFKTSTAELSSRRHDLSSSASATIGRELPKSAVLSLSPSVETYMGVLPRAYLSLHRGDEAAARKAYSETLAWRKELHMDEFLTIPQDHFNEILKWYPHAIHGRSKDGCVVLYEVLGKAKPKELTAIGVTNDALVWHFMLRNEYCFQRLLDGKNSSRSNAENSTAAEEVGQIMTVIDVKGVSISDISADVISFIKKSSDIMDAHYPGRVKRLIICNAPSWFYSVWSMVARVLPDSVRKKISIINGVKGLTEFIDPAQLPNDYGGTGPPLGQAAEHLAFVRLQEDWRTSNSGANARNPSIQHAEVKQGSSSNSDDKGRANSSKNNSNTNNTKERNNGSGKGGLFGWVTGGWSGTRSRKEAFLGDKNQFRYDPVTLTWKMDSDCDGCDSQKMSQDELEEHGLVLAIQAAHLASKTKRLTTEQANGEQGILDAELGLVSGWELAGHSASNPYAALNHQNRRDSRSYRSSPALRSVTNGVVAIEERERLLADNTSSSGSDSAPEIPREQVLQEDRPKLSAAVFLLVVLMYSVCCLMQSSISFIIPVWLASTSESGGLSVSVLHRGFLFSAASLLLYVGHILAGSYLTALVRSSPVRVLRLCCGCLVVLFFLSPITIRYFYGQISDAEPVLMKGAPAIQYSPFLLKDSDSASSGKRNSSSLMALILASGLLALTGGVAYAARKASGMLFYLALAPTFTSPTVLITAVAGFADVSGPVLGALIFCSVYDLRLSVPMDASFVLSCCGCACSLTYLLSLLINIQFRGDFGLITDEGTAKTNSSIHSNSQGNYFSTPSGMSRSSGSSSGSNLLDVPMGDLSLLLSPPITGYGTRHDSLRIDLKEV